MKTVSVATASPAPANLVLLAKAVAIGDDEPGMARQVAERLNMPHIVKTQFEPHLTSDSDLEGLNDSRTILTSFAPLLRNTSAFFALLDDDMIRRVPLRTRISFLAGAAEFGAVNEAQVIRLRRILMDTVLANPHRVTGIVAFSNELLKWLSTGGEAFLSQELRRAIAAAVDREFFAVITDGNTPTTTSAGTTATAASIDMRALFSAAELTAESRPLIVVSPDVALMAATLFESGFVFPAMSPTGGTMCNVPAVVTDGLAAGTLGLVDGQGLVGGAEGIRIRSARHASLQLDDNPDSPTTASTNLVSLWQHDLTGLMPEIYFAAARLRDSAFTTVTGVTWGSTDSP